MTGISRITRAFESGKSPLLITCMVAGDPDYAGSVRIARVLARAGADMLEVVMPFSDPVADGPVIQEAGARALSAGMTTDRLFSLIREVREHSAIPLLIMTYANIVIQRGVDRFYQDAARAGADGVVVADVPVEEAGPFCDAAREAGVDPILFVSPDTSPERLDFIISQGKGFTYLVAARGVTGVREEVAPETLACLGNIKKRTKLPVVPGFGISTPEHIRAYTWAGADGVIVGSAIVGIVGEFREWPAEMDYALQKFVKELKTASGHPDLEEVFVQP